MNTKEFCARVGARSGYPRDLVHKILIEAIGYGKEIIAEGDEWRLPGLGKFFCAELPAAKHLDRFKAAKGETVYYNLSERKRIRFKFVPYESANSDVNSGNLNAAAHVADH